MGFSVPGELSDYLNKDWRRPPQNFVDCSLYYTGLDVFFIDYMNRVVRPCMAYSNGCADNTLNSGVKMNIGYSLKNTAVKLIKGDKILFDGNDTACRALSDVWVPGVGFETFMESAIDYMLMGGTTAVKLNRDAMGRLWPAAVRVDRYYADTDENGNITHITIFNSFLYSESFGRKSHRQYWLIEERYYNESLQPCVIYKVHLKSGIAGKELLPTLDAGGIPEDELPVQVRGMLRRKGIVLNREQILPFRDGLGVWSWRRTANNSCVPGLAMGDPLLYGALDMIWAADTVFSGTVTDVILGRGKILVPKKYLQTIREDFQRLGIKTSLGDFTDDMSDSDDSLVYIYTEQDKDFTPQAVQFDIRSEAYRGMFELYLRQIATHCGFAPTSVFPFLQDQSAKTATEVTAEENLTRATVQSIHQTIVPAVNRMLAEVLFQYGFKGCARIKLTDYIGNKIQRDQNIRDNYVAGLMPRDVAVQQINNISAGETQEYLAKLDEEKQTQFDFTEAQYAGYLNDHSEQTAELASNSAGRSGNENQAGGER